MTRILTLIVALVLAMAFTVPAFAATGTGVDYGTHHADHAQEAGGFTGTMNPGVMHQGFSGWMGV